MLNKPIEDIIVENGKIVGVKSEGEVRNYYFMHAMDSITNVVNLETDSGNLYFEATLLVQLNDGRIKRTQQSALQVTNQHGLQITSSDSVLSCVTF